MRILQVKTQLYIKAVIERLEAQDWEFIRLLDQFEFKWIREKAAEVYKLRVENAEEILGLISIEDIPKEWRMHIRLIECSISNQGRNKEYDLIAGCLIAFICQSALEKEGYDGFVSLEPKTALTPLYREKYGFTEFGKYLFSDLGNSERLVKKYLQDE